MLTNDNIESECNEISELWKEAHEDKPYATGHIKPDEFGAFKKRYTYKAGYDEVHVDTYENGGSILNTVTGYQEWFIGKKGVSICIKKAKLLKQRYGKLNRLMR